MTISINYLNSLRYIYPNSIIKLLTIRNDGEDLEKVEKVIHKMLGNLEFNYNDNVKLYLLITYNEDDYKELEELLSNQPIHYTLKRASQRDYLYLNHIADNCVVSINIE